MYNNIKPVFVIIGGGAAGFMAAITCKENAPNARVIILEKSKNVLAKVKVSGGGRCNVTNAETNPIRLSKFYPRTHKLQQDIFKEFGSIQTVEWFKKRGVKLHTEADGRMFPESNNSETIIYCLTEQCRKLGVEISVSTGVNNIIPIENEGFKLVLNNDSDLIANKVLIATGGTPSLDGYKWLSGLKLPVEAPIPSLFTFNVASHPLVSLMGLSVENATVKIVGTNLVNQGPLLITHWGFSGPAVIKLSAWAAKVLAEKKYLFSILINWLGAVSELHAIEQLNDFKAKHPQKLVLGNRLFDIPSRLWEYFCTQSGVLPSTKWCEISKKQFNKLVQTLVADLYEIKGKTTFKEEFVTAGGISLEAINMLTMESKTYKNLYFAGEIMNIDGITGGFNFQHAWTSGYLAGKNMAEG